MIEFIFEKVSLIGDIIDIILDLVICDWVQIKHFHVGSRSHMVIEKDSSMSSTSHNQYALVQCHHDKKKAVQN